MEGLNTGKKKKEHGKKHKNMGERYTMGGRARQIKKHHHYKAQKRESPSPTKKKRERQCGWGVAWKRRERKGG